MNERIKELIKLATTVEDTYPAGCNGHPMPLYGFDKEKFAELVINASVKFLKENDCDFEAEQLADYWSQE